MKKILVVDNNPVMLEFMQEILSQAGYSVDTVDNGIDALTLAEKNTPEVIFVDLVMPQIDGTQLCRLLRRKEELADSRIVIMSAIAAEEPELDFSGYADAYVAKMPFKRMKSYIMDLLKDFEKNGGGEHKQGIIGLDQIYHRDITKELLFSKQHMEVLISSISDGFIELSPQNQIIYLNDAATGYLNGEREELLTAYFPSFFQEDIAARIESAMASLNGSEIEIGEKERVILQDRRVKLRFNTVEYGEYRSVIVMIQDISSQKQAEQIIKDDLKEKELLLKEVHHRVKNNLNVVASLLNLQTSFLEDPASIKHLTDSKNRVESMALIHEQLYHTEDLSGVFLDSYLEDLVAQLLDIYNTHPSPVRTTIDIPAIHLDLSLAVPLGLIINELLTNSLEHGLKDEPNGRIDIRLIEEGEYCRLVVHDNGCGLPEDFDPSDSESLGLLLVSNLAKQIEGSFKQENENGLKTTIRFKRAAKAVGTE